MTRTVTRTSTPPERAELTVIKTAEPVNIRGILQSKGQMTADEFSQLRRAIATDQIASTKQEIESLLREVESGGASSQSVRAGIGAYLLAQHAVAERLLSSASGDGVALYVQGMACLSLEKFLDAESHFAAASKAGYDPVECTMKRLFVPDGLHSCRSG
jgi:DNA-directed RNA polymerase subunit alpha